MPTATIVAVKRLDQNTTADELIAMMREARVMQLCDNANIVKFHGYAVGRRPYALIMEYCNGGSVEDRLRQHKKYPVAVKKRANWLTQAVLELEYIHTKKCIHNGIAASNCLLSRDSIKIAGFGHCRRSAVYKVNLAKPLNVRWLAPEVWKTGETNYCTNVYALAVMAREFFIIPYETPYKEWKEDDDVKEQVMDGFRMPPPPTMPSAVAEVMEQLWAHDPAQRPSVADAKKLFGDAEEAADEKPDS